MSPEPSVAAAAAVGACGVPVAARGAAAGARPAEGRGRPRQVPPPGGWERNAGSRSVPGKNEGT